MTHPHIRDELGGYVLGALEPAEREAVAAHLERCPECAAEHERLVGLPALLRPAEGLEIPTVPAGAEERLLDRVAVERGAKRRRGGGRLGRRRGGARLGRWSGMTRTRAAVAAAVAGAALGAGATALAVGVGRGDDGDAPAAAYALRLTGDAGAAARVELEPGRGGTEVHMWVTGLPPGAEAVYEVRCERPGWSASAGTFRADARGRAYVVLTTAARIGEYERIRVVRRSPTRESAVLSGDIQ